MSTQSRSTRVLFALAGHSRTGLRLKQLAEAIGEQPSTTLRVLQRLRDDGLVEAVPDLDKHWRLSARIVQIALMHHAEVQHEEQKLNDFKNRYSRHPF